VVRGGEGPESQGGCISPSLSDVALPVLLSCVLGLSSAGGPSECAARCVGGMGACGGRRASCWWPWCETVSLNLAGTFGIDRAVWADWVLRRFVLHRRGRGLRRQLWASISATELGWAAHVWLYIERCRSNRPHYLEV